VTAATIDVEYFSERRGNTKRGSAKVFGRKKKRLEKSSSGI